MSSAFRKIANVIRKISSDLCKMSNDLCKMSSAFRKMSSALCIVEVDISKMEVFFIGIYIHFSGRNSSKINTAFAIEETQ